MNISTPFSEMKEVVYSACIRSLCIFVDILTVCYTFLLISNTSNVLL